MIIKSPRPQELLAPIEQFCRQHNYVCMVVLTRYEDHTKTEDETIAQEEFQNIKFLTEANEIYEINGFNNQMINNCDRDYYNSFVYYPKAIVQKIRQEHLSKQKDYVRYLAVKDNSVLAELGYIKMKESFYPQENKAMCLSG